MKKIIDNLKNNKLRVYFIISSFGFFLSERDEFFRAFDLILVLSVAPVLEGLYIICCILQKYLVKFMQVESIL